MLTRGSSKARKHTHTKKQWKRWVISKTTWKGNYRLRDMGGLKNKWVRRVKSKNTGKKKL